MPAKSKATEEEKAFYIGVKNPENLRRNILESSRDIIGILKQHHKLKQLRDQKKDAAEKLNAEIKEIKSGLAKLKKAFPAVPVRDKPVDVSLESKAAPSEPMTKKVMSEVDKLEAELQQVESKLANL